jgi:Leucine-rich repeat (LRR) protein
LNNNKLKQIQIEITKIKILQLNNNELNRIQINSLTNLKELQLENNELESIAAATNISFGLYCMFDSLLTFQNGQAYVSF